jgi:hypothetical protein
MNASFIAFVPFASAWLALVAVPSPDPEVLIYRMAASNPPLRAEEIGRR